MAECSGKKCTLIKKLLDSKALNCQSCKKLLQTPAFLVDAVGNVCEQCMLKNEWKGLRNEIFDVFIKDLIIPCENVSVGCNEEISHQHFEEHSKLCKYRSVECPHQECTWMGWQDGLYNHFLESHEASVIESDTFCFELNFQEEPPVTSTKLLVKRGLKYIFVLKQDKEANELACALFKFHEGAPSSTTVMFRNPPLKECHSFEVDLNQLDLIDKDYVIAKINLKSLRLMLREDNDKMSITVDLPPAEFLLQNLECPICNESMGPPIFQCSKGHTICKNCVERLEKCPSCTAVISKDIRNYHLENSASNMFYPCAYKTAGCKAVLSGDDIMNHEPKCLYRLFQCPMDDCDFKYNSKTVLDHLKVEHQDLTTKYQFSCQHGQYEPGISEAFMYIDGSFFHLTYKRTCKVYYYNPFHGYSNKIEKHITTVNLKFEKLNSDKMIGPLYCKITLTNLTDEASVTQIQHLENVCDGDEYSISVPLGAFADCVDASREGDLWFECELLMQV